MIGKLFDIDPLLGASVCAALAGLVGCFEFYVLRNRRAACITWGVVGVGLAAAVILRLLGLWLS